MEDGIISSIYLENFVTYEKAYIKPGRFLNVIIGPNGTGKSTIVCAIVIGLGGKLSIIGRATDIGEYIKTGHSKAKIAIILKTANSEVKIQRNFDRNNLSTWVVNDKNTSQKNVEALIKKFNIQMDNLCQFLPQDKVQEFSNLSSVELFIETLRSAGDPSLLETLIRLKQLRAEHRELERLIVKKNDFLTCEINKYEGLQHIVGNVKERKKIKKKIENLIQKKAWLLYDEKRKELIKLKKDRDEWDKKVKKLTADVKPITKKLADMERNINKFKNLDTSQTKEIVEKSTKIKKLCDKINTLDEEILDTEETWKSRIETEKNREKEVQLITQQIEKMKNDLQTIIDESGSDVDLENKQKTLLLEIDSKRKEIQNLKEQVNSLRSQDNDISREITRTNMEMQRIQNVRLERLELLRRKSPDAYKGVLWLQNNRDKFSSVIHDPIMLNINVKNRNYAKYLENVIPQRDLVAFVCEDKEDMNLLVNYLRVEQKLQINILHSDPDKNVNMNPRIPIEQIQSFGFENYLITLFEAPSNIMKYLVSMYHLQDIPFGNNMVDSCSDRVPHEIRMFFSAEQKYRVNISKYSGATSTSIDTISSFETLTITLDMSLLEDINGRLALLNNKKCALARNIQSINEHLDQLNKKLELLRNTRSQYQKSRDEINTLCSKIERTIRRQQEIKNDVMDIDNINNMYKSNIQNILRNCFTINKEINKLLEECIKNTFETENGRLLLRIHQRKYATATNEYEELKTELERTKRQFKQLDNELVALKKLVERRLQEAKDLSDGLSPDKDGFKKLTAVYNKLPPTIQEIDQSISELRVKLCCLGSSANGEQVLETFEKTEQSINSTKTLIEEKTAERDRLSEEMSSVHSQWFSEVQGLTNKVNKNFSDYFSKLNCTGELCLVHNNDFDFDQYGLKIMVKFREADSLQELTRTHQSGGERALTTAVYMIALQNLSRVPFRCVDEINQGMDPLNERRVFQLLAEITQNSEGSQYFFLTPKLLPKLQYPNNVTVHCVFNGPFVTPHTEFTISDYVKNIKETLESENYKKEEE